MPVAPKLALAGAAMALACASAPATGIAKDFPPLVREPLLQQALPPGTPVPKMVKAARIRFAPGQPTTRHLHPASVVGVVTKGEFVFQIEGQTTKILHTGDAFFEPAQTPIAKFDNASQTEPAEIVAIYLLDSPDRPLIQLLPPDGQ